MTRPIKKLLSVTVAWACITSTAMAQVYPLGTPDRTSVINAALDSFEASGPAPVQNPPPPPPNLSGNMLKVSGNVHTGMGVYSDGRVVFTRANADLNERSFRLLSSNQLNHNLNTYDPAIFSRLKVVMDASVAASVVSIHLNLSADPWSLTAKSKEMLVSGQGGDQAKIQYLWWGNTGYTVNTIVHTLQNGDSMALPELKPQGRVVPALSQTSNFGNIFDIPSAKLDYAFQPVREAWVDVKTYDNGKLRVFPMGYENQALTTDDPLKLSNNREWWDSSPWLNGWQGGILNTGGTPVDFTKGQWDKSLAFLTKDSDGQRLTALRGVSFEANPTDETSIKATIASPKTLWQDYDDFTALPASARLKQFFGNLFYIGVVANMHQGFVDGNRDAQNFTEGLDTAAILFPGVKFSAEYAASQSRYDITTPDYATEYRGNAYFAALEYSSNPEEMINKDYFGLSPVQKTDAFYKSRLYFARMDQGFESSLSDYHQTRDDSFWSGHLTFYPSDYRYMPGVIPTQSEYDLAPFAIGNGIDYGRSAFGWRQDTNLVDGRLQGLADVRYVMTNDEETIETVARTLWTYQLTDKLTAKALLLAHQLPKTHQELIGGIMKSVDPFIIDGTTGKPLVNDAVVPGEDPSLRTGSLGARYALTDWAALNGVWEYTNDVTVATDNFPQGVLNSASVFTYTQYGKTYRETLPFLYNQGYFDQAPYEYHHVFKAGLELTPSEKWHIYLDYTRNPNKFSGNIDDNMNHFGIETSYLFTPKMGLFARYTYSKWYDLDRLVFSNQLDYRAFHNVFIEFRMILPKDLLMSIQYGVGPAYNVATSTSDPNLAFYSTAVVQTQHVVRVMFDKKF